MSRGVGRINGFLKEKDGDLFQGGTETEIDRQTQLSR